MKKLILILILIVSSLSYAKVDTLYKSKDFKVWLHDNYHLNQSKYLTSHLIIEKNGDFTPEIKWVFNDLPYDSLFYIDKKDFYVASHTRVLGELLTIKFEGSVKNATMIWEITSYDIYNILELKHDIFKIYEKRYGPYYSEQYVYFTNIILSNTTAHQRIIFLELLEALKQYFLLK